MALLGCCQCRRLAWLLDGPDGKGTERLELTADKEIKSERWEGYFPIHSDLDTTAAGAQFTAALRHDGSS